MENTVKEMKNTLEEVGSRITEVEEWICDLQDRMVEASAAEQNKGKHHFITEAFPDLCRIYLNLPSFVSSLNLTKTKRTWLEEALLFQAKCSA